MKLNRNPYPVFVPLLLSLFLGSFFLLSSCSPVKTLERQIRKTGFDYSLDYEGDFRVQVILPEDRTVEVGVSAHSDLLDNDIRVRKIWSVAGRIPEKLPEGLAENLLGDSWSTRVFGSWALAGTTSEGKKVLVYVSRIPESSSPDLLYASLIDAAVSAQGLHDALSILEEND